MRKKIASLVVCLAAVGVLSLPAGAADDDAPKYKTKEIMKAAFKGPLIKKVASGQASDDDKAKLHEMLVALSKNKAPKGEADSWDKLTGALVKAGKAAVDGDPKAAGMLKKAANCKACHKEHKP